MENTIPHPSAFIESEDVTIIRDAAPKAEQLGMLHPNQLAIVYRQKWFRLLVPQVYGGVQLTLPNLVRLQEAISWADGSTGWVVTLCSGAGWFGGFIDPVVARHVFNGTMVCLAGSGAASGTATITPGGYLVNGCWKYASGAHHATHITANCVIKNGNETVLSDNGEPLILPFIVDKKDVNILPAWKYTGMVATGSDAFAIKNLAVDGDRQFKIEPAIAIVDATLYKYPFLQLAEATLAVNISGMAIHFVDLCVPIFEEKQKTSKLTDQQKKFMRVVLLKQKNKLNKERQSFFRAVDTSWNSMENGSGNNETLSEVSQYSRELAKIARNCVDTLYPYCGLLAANNGTEINRVWRDIHTASQHSLLTFA